MKLDELKQIYLTFPQLHEMKKRWHHGYWDGALSGVCEINGKLHWFQCVDQLEDSPEEEDENLISPWCRRFLIWSLPDDVMSTIVEQHEKFRVMVGHHTDYDENGKKVANYLDAASPATTLTTKTYFEEKMDFPNTLPADPSQIVGWWEWK